MRTYGRTTITAGITEEELLALPIEEQNKFILGLLTDIINIHGQNKAEIQYLWEYYLGVQDILYKEKQTRKDINNKKVENWAYAMVDFKKAWLLGKPIQYTMANSTTSKEIAQLNQYCSYEGKQRQDQLLYEDVLVVGRGFRYIQKDIKSDNEEDEAPFSIINVDNDKCEVIYSSKIGKQQLFSVVETEMKQLLPRKDANGEAELDLEGNPIIDVEYYSDYTIYLRNRSFTVSMRTGSPIIVPNSDKPIIINEHIITEYYVNRNRISMIELGKDLFDGINQMESLDFDDMQQFVNAIMVFTNADIDEEGLDAIQEFGAVKIKSTENRKASVELLQQRLNASDTQVFYTRLLVALHEILGIPMQSDNGSVTSGDTGKAKLTGQGFTSAGIRIKTDEVAIKDCDRKALKLILKICRKAENSNIKSLKLSDIEIQIDMDKSENLLVKTQALQTLLSAKVPEEYAIPIVNLFNDSTAVVNGMKKAIEEAKIEFQKQQQMGINGKSTSNGVVNQVNEQNNKIQDTLEKAEQDK